MTDWRIQVDGHRCAGSGTCVASAPQFFELRDGVSAPVAERVRVRLRSRVRLRWVPGGRWLADNAEYFRFAEVLASYAYGKSPQSGKPPH
jgi:hypothetical protein